MSKIFEWTLHQGGQMANKTHGKKLSITDH